MSAPAIKSSMPGVGTPTASTGHTMLPMNMVAQKVVPSTDQSSGGMKPLQGTNLNYVTLQPSNQPLSLIQEHRAPSYQTSFANNIPTEQQPTQQSQQQQNKELESMQDSSKLIQNGTEQTKLETEKKDGFVSSVSFSTTSLVTNATTTLTTATPTSTTITTQTLTSSSTPILASATAAISSIPSSTALPITSNMHSIPSTNASTTDSVTTATTTLSVSAAEISPIVTPTSSVSSTLKTATEQPKKINNVDGSAQEHQEQPSETTQKSKEDFVQSKSDQADGLAASQNKVEEKKTLCSVSKEETSPTTLAGTSAQKVTQPPGLVPPKLDENGSKTEAPIQKSPKVQMTKLVESPEKIEAKEVKTPISTRPVKRKSRELKEPKSTNLEGGPRSKRNRVQTTPYQSPLPEIAMIVKNLSKPSPRGVDDKLIVFYKNEFLAVRNTEGSFYVCQAMQNIYKSSKRIRIRWLSQDKNNGEIYSPDFYDHTDFDCILTNLNLNKVEKNKYQLTKYELLRTENILKRAIDVEAGVSEKPRVTEEHPDGLDLSLYKDEAQLKKRKGKGKSSKGNKSKRLRKKANKNLSDSDDDDDDDESEDDEDDESDESSSKSEASEIKSPMSPRKGSPTKKRSGNKAAITQTPPAPRGPSRAERALNRSKGLVGPSTSGVSISNLVTPTKKASELKKQIVKPGVPSTSASTSGQARAKPRGTVTAPILTVTAQVTPTQEAKSAGGRPKRVASATTPIAATSTSSEDNSSRKKSRGRT